MTCIIRHTDASGHSAILTQSIFQRKSRHRQGYLSVLMFSRNQKIMQLNKCFLSIIVVCIDNHKRLFHDILTSQNRLSCTPRFHTPHWDFIPFWQILQFLINILDRHDLRQSIPDHFFKFFFNRLADHKNYLCKSCFFCIID